MDGKLLRGASKGWEILAKMTLKHLPLPLGARVPQEGNGEPEHSGSAPK